VFFQFRSVFVFNTPPVRNVSKRLIYINNILLAAMFISELPVSLTDKLELSNHLYKHTLQLVFLQHK